MPARHPSHYIAELYAEALQRACDMSPSLPGLLPAPPIERLPFQRPPSLQEILASLPTPQVDFRTISSTSNDRGTV